MKKELSSLPRLQMTNIDVINSMKLFFRVWLAKDGHGLVQMELFPPLSELRRTFSVLCKAWLDSVLNQDPVFSSKPSTTNGYVCITLQIDR